MGNNAKERKLSPALRHKIDSLDKARPYVWRLRLTEADFQELESCLEDSVADHGGSCTHLLSTDCAMTVVTYLAEWYKRRYQSGETACVLHLDSEQLKELWNATGLNQQVFLYRDESGNRRWLYSLYVLGGLAIRHELSRPDSMRFLRGLCRIYHGENFTLENLDDVGRAASFRESIRRKHSLYEYMLTLLSDGFGEGDGDEERRFIEAVKKANDEVLRQKFRLEWLVSHLPNERVMHRSLRLWLCPEEVGGGLYQYLRYDRVHLWGVPFPEKQQSLRIAVGFYDGCTEVCAPNWNHPLITYSNTGSADCGFVSWGIERSVTLRHVPTQPFTKIVIYVKTEDEITYIAGQENAADFMQLWQTDDMVWSSRQNAQHATALLWAPTCHLKIGPAAQGQVHLAAFVDGQQRSEEWGWFYIYDNVIIVDANNKEHAFYNRNGYDQIYTRRYENIIEYTEGGLIRRCYEDEDGEDDELLPLVYSRHDVLVRHFDTKDAISDARVSEEGEAELMEWKQDNGYYTPWTDAEQPPFGRVSLRISIKGQTRALSVAYLPGLEGEQPIVRDFENKRILYKSIEGNQMVVEDDIQQNGIPLEATLKIKVAKADEYYELPTYRPTLQKEICIGNKVVSYMEGQVVLPYILKQEVTLRDFNEDGFRSYDCSQLTGIYPIIKQQVSVYQFWEDGYALPATALDATAPKCLLLSLGASGEDIPEGLDFYQWDYDKEREPWKVKYSAEPERNTLVFQSLAQLNKELVNLPVKRNFFAFKYRTVVVKKMSLFNCFEVAARHRLYFFALEPMTQQHDKGVWRTEIYEPLMDKRSGQLSECDIFALQRLAEEMDFDWQELGVKL